MKKAILLTLALLSAYLAPAQVSTYSFRHEQGQYNSLSSPVYQDAVTIDLLVHDDYLNPEKVPIPFPFRFNGQLVDSVGIHASGYIWFGPARWLDLANQWPISTQHPSAVKGIVSTLGVDMHPQPVGAGIATTVRAGSIGTAPARMMIIEWENTTRDDAYSSFQPDTISFQIRLYESSNRVEILYGDCLLNPGITSNAEVGIKGATYADYNNRVLSGPWNTSTAGSSQLSRSQLSSTSKPGWGQILAWEPGQTPSSVPEKENASFRLFPIPAYDKLFISDPMHAFHYASWTIQDITGRQWMSGVKKYEDFIQINALPVGNYILEIKGQTLCIQRRFSKAQ